MELCNVASYGKMLKQNNADEDCYYKHKAREVHNTPYECIAIYHNHFLSKISYCKNKPFLPFPSFTAVAT